MSFTNLIITSKKCNVEVGEIGKVAFKNDDVAYLDHKTRKCKRYKYTEKYILIR